ncbi:MAG: ABC-2 family transporter protein [Planctomycetes bacterium]|nr:ABC-2 family transporter protein [Planctomycetota bacterium]
MDGIGRYRQVLLTFARNSLVRDMSFRANFIIEAISAVSWIAMNLGFYELIFSYTDTLGANTGWGKYQFFVFFATTTIISGIVEAFFMYNAEEFGELIRTGNLDFALLKPIDTQFLVSLQKIDWSSLSSTVIGGLMLVFAVWKLETTGQLSLTFLQVALYPVYVLCGVGIFYSLMISLAATSVWLGRNQSLQQFWFYITIFARYPMEIYDGPGKSGPNLAGKTLWGLFTFVIPVLVAVNIPARLLAMPLSDQHWGLVLYALGATVASLWLSRRLFKLALGSYRSASS